MEEHTIKKLMASVKCSFCGQQYEACDIEILGSNNGLWFLKVLCLSCRTRSLVAAMVEECKLLDILTDLTEVEQGNFAGADMVGEDDVLVMHDFLNEFNADSSRLFGRR
ncbi:hypothetical protein ACFLWZ_02250 [Chloroflexota bacterium]